MVIQQVRHDRLATTQKYIEFYYIGTYTAYCDSLIRYYRYTTYGRVCHTHPTRGKTRGFGT